MNSPPFDPGTRMLALDGVRGELGYSGMRLAKAQESGMELSAGERAELLDWLWDGLQSPGVLELQEQWAAEAEERIDAVDRGELPAVDGPTALEDQRRSFGA
ncbi:MAG TPA: addiction module protein [Candidatus Paceibacterota bacterium]|nr:addiction module protein [Candidatus Paceibacterota bacterium]